MTVLDQLRAHEHCATREQELRRHAHALLDVLRGDLEGQELYDALEQTSADLAGFLIEFDDRPESVQKSDPSAKGAAGGSGSPARTAGTATKRTRKKSAKKPTRKATTKASPSKPDTGDTGRACEICGAVKALDQFRKKGRGRSRSCTDCDPAAAPKPAASNGHGGGERIRMVATCPEHGDVAEDEHTLTRDQEAAAHTLMWGAVQTSQHAYATRCSRKLEAAFKPVEAV